MTRKPYIAPRAASLRLAALCNDDADDIPTSFTVYSGAELSNRAGIDDADDESDPSIWSSPEPVANPSDTAPLQDTRE